MITVRYDPAISSTLSHMVPVTFPSAAQEEPICRLVVPSTEWPHLTVQYMQKHPAHRTAIFTTYKAITTGKKEKKKMN